MNQGIAASTCFGISVAYCLLLVGEVRVVQLSPTAAQMTSLSHHFRSAWMVLYYCVMYRTDVQYTTSLLFYPKTSVPSPYLLNQFWQLNDLQ